MTSLRDLNPIFDDSDDDLFPTSHIPEQPSIERISTSKNWHSLAAQKSGQAVRHRKLPGPAGLLSKSGEFHHHDILLQKISKRTKSSLCDANESNSQSQSQGEETVLLSRLQADCGSKIWDYVKKYSIKSILKMMVTHQLPRGKVPLICGFLDDIELLPTDARATLKDDTGILGCTIHRSVIQQYKYQLGCCSLLLLKQVSIFSPTGKTFYANVTLSNVVAVYTSDNSLTTFKNNSNSSAIYIPLSAPELKTIEEECLRPVSPKFYNIQNEFFKSSHPSPSAALPRQKHSQSSDVILHPSTLVGKHSGFGSLLKGGIPKLKYSPPYVRDTAQDPCFGKSRKDTITCEVSSSAHLLEDDMDDFLSSVLDVTAQDLDL